MPRTSINSSADFNVGGWLLGIALFGAFMLAAGVWIGAQPAQASAPTPVCAVSGGGH